MGMLMNRLSVAAALVYGMCVASASNVLAQLALHDTFRADFYQLANEEGTFDYELRLGTNLTLVFSTAEWIGPGGVNYGTAPGAVITRDSFAELGSAAFGSWRVQFTPRPLFRPTLGNGPVNLEFNITPFSLTGLQTSRSTIVFPPSGSIIPLDAVDGGVIEVTWTYEDGASQSGRSITWSTTGVELDGDFLGGYPEVYRVRTTFEAGRSSGSATIRAGGFNSDVTNVTGDPTFHSLFLPSSTWRNLSAPATYSFVPTPEPSGQGLMIAAMASGARLGVRRRLAGPRDAPTVSVK
jgi:hypothetical protein